MNKTLANKIALWTTGVLAVLILAACGQTPIVDPGGTSSLDVNVNGNGTVTSDVGGINCTAAGGDTCIAAVDDGTTVTLTAVANEGETFVGWGGACSGSDVTCTVTVDADTSVTATFSGAQVGDGQSFFIVSEDDDAEELNSASAIDPVDFPAGHNFVDSSDLDLAYDAAHETLQHIGLRFSDVTIPQGAVIESAHIAFVAAGGGTAGPVTVTIAGQDSVTPESFQDDPDTTGSSDLSDRPVTDARVDWEITEAWTDGATVDSADLTAVVQEIVNTAEWTAGNAMAFILTGNNTTDYRTVQSFGEGRTAPVLVVEYSEAAPEAPAEPAAQ